MKDYQKERLNNLLNFITVKRGGKLLIVTLAKDDTSTSLAELEREKEFLVEAKSHFSARGMQAERQPIDGLQSMWDDKMYDTILLRYVLFHQRNCPMNEKKCLRLLGRHLTENGKIYVLEHNRLGLDVLAGDRFDGMGKERGLLRSELAEAFRYAGLSATFYYPYPCAEDMEYLFSDRRLPQDEVLGTAAYEGVPRLEFFNAAQAASEVAAESIYPSVVDSFLCVVRRDGGVDSLASHHYAERRDKRFQTTKSANETAGAYQKNDLEKTSSAIDRNVAVDGRIATEKKASESEAKTKPIRLIESLVFRHYDVRRDKRFRMTKSVNETADGRRTITCEPVGEAAAAHIKGIYANFSKLEELYKGYTLQITPCLFENGRAVRRQSEEETLEQQLDDAVEREAVEEFFGLIQRMSDILTAPTRILQAEKREAFSDEPRFARMFGELLGKEEDLLAKETALPISLIDGAFSDFRIEGKKWTLTEYEWAVDFPVPYPYLLYRMIHRYFSAKPWRDAEGTLEAETLRRFGISEEMEPVFARMEGRFQSYVVGRSMTAEKVLEQCRKDGTFLPVGELVSAFVDENGQIPLDESEEFEDVGGGFKEKMLGLLKGLGF